MQSRELIQTALMVALCVAVGYLMAALPNIEVISAAVFTCGLLAGMRRGALVGFAAELLYAGLNPYGVSQPLLLAAQLLGMTLMGVTGGLVRTLGMQRSWFLLVSTAAISGFLLTLVFDVATNSAIFVSLRGSVGYIPFLIGGLTFPFPLAHALTNSVSFAIVAPAVQRAVERWSPT